MIDREGDERHGEKFYAWKLSLVDDADVFIVQHINSFHMGASCSQNFFFSDEYLGRTVNIFPTVRLEGQYALPENYNKYCTE